MVDNRLTNRLIGETAENIFLSLVNKKGVAAVSFDTIGLDGIAFDPDHKLFKRGQSPFYVQVKCGGSDGDQYGSKGLPQKEIDGIGSAAENLGIPHDSLYFVAGFLREATCGPSSTLLFRSWLWNSLKPKRDGIGLL